MNDTVVVEEMGNLDEDLTNADWLKRSWDLPPYKSPEFMQLVPDLAAFRKLPVYKFAVERGLIVNDEWKGVLVNDVWVGTKETPKQQTEE